MAHCRLSDSRAGWLTRAGCCPVMCSVCPSPGYGAVGVCGPPVPVRGSPPGRLLPGTQSQLRWVTGLHQALTHRPADMVAVMPRDQVDMWCCPGSVNRHF